MLLFEVAVILLMLFTYIAVISELERQTRYTIQTEAMELRSNFLSQKLPKTVAVIKNKIAQDFDRVALYLLVDKDRNILAGNTGDLPIEIFLPKNDGADQTLINPTGDWFAYHYINEPGIDSHHTKIVRGIAYRVSLPKGLILVVGNHLRYLEKVQQIILRVITVSTVLATVLAVAVGLLMNRMLMRRMEAINMTARHIMEGALSERITTGGSGDEFDHLAENLNAMLNRIEALVAGIKQVSDNIAHDLRTPLNGIRHRIEGLMVNPPKESQMREELRVILGRIDRLVSTFNAILQIAQIESGGVRKTFQAFDLSDVIVSISDFYEPLAEEKGQWMISDIEENISYIGDFHLIAQAVANLLDNAIKYTPSHGSITVSLKSHEHDVVLTVRDSGPGISPEFYEKVTERFFRIEHSRTSKGSGLGLSLVKAIVNLHHGKLVFADNMPGLCASLVLPRKVQE